MEELLHAPARLLHSLVHRPYAFALFGLFAVAATWHLGWQRWLWMTVAGYGIAWASELSSIHTGFPYGRYAYLDEALEGDLLVAGVPFFDSLSYTFLAYFSWATAIFLVCPVHVRGRFDVQVAETVEARRSWKVLLLAGWLMTWLDVVIDPVARLGERWFLGEIFEYEAQGAYFGVPLSNFAGWWLTGTAIVAGYQWIDRRSAQGPAAGERRVFAQGLIGPAGYLAVALFGIGVAFALGETRLALSGTLLQLPVWVWMARRIFHPAERARRSSGGAGERT